jgi:hypothetical protein
MSPLGAAGVLKAGGVMVGRSAGRVGAVVAEGSAPPMRLQPGTAIRMANRASRVARMATCGSRCLPHSFAVSDDARVDRPSARAWL